jgi:hypothetical protein
LRQFTDRYLSWVAMIVGAAGAIAMAFDELKRHA